MIAHLPNDLLDTLALSSSTQHPSLSAGLRNTYTSVFSLDDSLADIKTNGDLFEYLGVVSERARLVQPTSSVYLVEQKGELKLLTGMCPNPPNR